MVRAHILIVDDEPGYADMVSMILEQAGYETSAARNGDQALRQHAERPADLWLLDIFMPDKDGFEALRELRARGEQVPVICVSSSAVKEYLEIAERMGAVGTLRKPFDPDDLVQLVDRALATARH